MAWPWKWSRKPVLVSSVEGIERVEVPVYRSTGGPLFKTALSSACRMDCLYCPFRSGSRVVPRERWDARRLVEAFMAAYREGGVVGLFLTSGLYGDPDRVVEDMLGVLERLRRRGYRGYIHLRLMPGVSKWYIREALRLADRVGINMEAPSPGLFYEVAPSKADWRRDIVGRLRYAAALAGPGRVDTQLVVGAAGETDEEILEAMELARSIGVGVMHFSPYTPIRGTPLAERRPPTPPARSNILYQAWSLMTRYRISVRDLRGLLDDHGMLPRVRSLKEALASMHPEWFPVDPLGAGFSELVRVPGIGPRRARAIIALRERGGLDVYTLRRILGPAWGRAARYLDLSSLRGGRLA